MLTLTSDVNRRNLAIATEPDIIFLLFALQEVSSDETTRPSSDETTRPSVAQKAPKPIYSMVRMIDHNVNSLRPSDTNMRQQTWSSLL